VKKPNYLKLDFIWGVERSQQSVAFNTLVCPIVNLWRSPESVENRSITGKLLHGTRVAVLEYRRVNGRKWCYVSDMRWLFPRRGWVKIEFLLLCGAQSYD